jgi:hypothetical protein
VTGGNLGIVQRAGLNAPDGRPLFAYDLEEADVHALSAALRQTSDFEQASQTVCASFALWASEEIRLHLQPGGLTWEWLFGRLEVAENQDAGRRLVERGLTWWKRRIARSESGNRQFLFSLLAESGLPDAYVAQASRYRAIMLNMLEDIERGGLRDAEAAEQAAERHCGSLPQTFRQPHTARLLAELALRLAELRQRLHSEPTAGDAVQALDQLAPGWRATLPLRLSEAALEALIRPALLVPKSEPQKPLEPLSRRELRLNVQGGWDAFAIVGEGSLVRALLPDASPELRLRLMPIVEQGAPPVFQGWPEPGGWRLSRAGSAAAAAVRLPLARALRLAAHADGRTLGEAIIDGGLPSPAIAPTFWRALDVGEDPPARLEQIPGAARTRQGQLYLLAGKKDTPVASHGLRLGEPSAACGGRLWPVSGRGELHLDDRRIRIETGADSDASAHGLLALGRPLRGWRCERRQPVIVGEPTLWGYTEGEALRRLKASSTRVRKSGSRLGGCIAEWCFEGEVVARTAFTTLPAGVELVLREVGPGRAQLTAQALQPGWSLRMETGDAAVATRADTDGRAHLELTAKGEPPTEVKLTLADTKTGAYLDIFAHWPFRRGMLIGPNGMRLQNNRSLAIGALSGWHGIAPEGASARLQLRYGSPPLRVSFPSANETRLAVVEQIVRLMLALAGPDAVINLRLLVSGDEGCRLELGRYDREVGAGVVNDAFLSASSTWRLHATPLGADYDDEPRTLQGVRGGIVLRDWLGGEGGPWLIQASAADGRVLRPCAWSARPGPAATRQQRISGYAQAWRDGLSVGDQDWWRARWRRIRWVRDGGDAAALDEVQALAMSPEAAVTMLFTNPLDEVGAAIALEGAAPVWWPVTPVAAWVVAMAAERRRLFGRLLKAFSEAEAARLAEAALSSRVELILTLRPELRGHLQRTHQQLTRAVPLQDGYTSTFASETDLRRSFDEAAQDAVKRSADARLEGVGDLPRAMLDLASRWSDEHRPLIDAPLLTAEIACGHRRAETKLLLQLIAIRQADPLWFDTALPLAIQLQPAGSST